MPGSGGRFGGSDWPGGITPSIPPQDLSGDHIVLSAPRTPVPGLPFPAPTLGGIPLLARIGRGGMGAVYYGIHPRLKVEVAVKVLPFHLAEQSGEVVERFVREAQAAAAVRSPHLVQVTDVNREGGVYYLVMEYVRGTTAGALIRRRTAAGGPGGLPEADALDICIAACEGLAAAHAEGIVHRDIKPDNILIPFRRRTAATGRHRPVGAEPDRRPGIGAGIGGGAGMGGAGSEAATEELDFRAAKLSDLGLARTEEGGVTLTGTAVCMGTPGYMSPEQADGRSREVTPASDVHALGAMMYELLCGVPPYVGESMMATLRKVVEEEPLPFRRRGVRVPYDLETIVLKCLEKDPGRRYRDAGELAEDLKRFLDMEPVLARRASVFYALRKKAAKHKGWTAAVVMLVLVAGVGVAGYWKVMEEREKAVGGWTLIFEDDFEGG
ncbi:MAG: serine/threonine protein kinase, partial [Planctomycetota bacterium]|nr:serine/threonine protein kinase [Planctomycetota bacterium]